LKHTEQVIKRGKPGAGFTLLEVLTALAILGSAVFVLLDAHYAALRLHTSIYDEVMLRRLMEQAAAAAEVKVMIGELQGSEEFGPRFPEFQYAWEAVLAGEDELIPLYTVNVRIAGPDVQEDLTFYAFDFTLGQTGGEDGQMFERLDRATGGTASSLMNRAGGQQP
jgi:prepilin-type N-terminal cleavage/methylation domain-containing protein